MFGSALKDGGELVTKVLVSLQPDILPQGNNVQNFISVGGRTVPKKLSTIEIQYRMLNAVRKLPLFI